MYLNKKSIVSCLLSFAFLMVTGSICLAGSTMLTDNIKDNIKTDLKAPVNQKVIEMGPSAADDLIPEGVHIIKSKWEPADDGYEVYYAQVYNKTQNAYDKAYVRVKYYSNIEQIWVKGVDALAGSLDPMDRSWLRVRTKERRSQYDKIKIQVWAPGIQGSLAEIVMDN